MGEWEKHTELNQHKTRQSCVSEKETNALEFGEVVVMFRCGVQERLLSLAGDAKEGYKEYISCSCRTWQLKRYEG